MASVTTKARLVPALLRDRRGFRRFWIGQTISLFGDQFTLLALPLVAVLALDASPAQMGYLSAAGLLPNLLLSLHAGAWIDRRGHRRRVMIAADLGRAGLIATIPLAATLGALSLGQLYAVAFLTGTLSVLFMVAYSTLFVSLVPPQRYVEANSLLNGSRALSFVAGRSLGGLLVKAVSAPLALLADAASFLVSALCLGSIHPAEPPTEEPRARGMVGGGIRFLARSPVLLPQMAATTTINFFNYMFNALFIVYATRSLRVPPGTLGAVLGVAAVGSVLGSVVTGRLSRRIGIGPAFVLGCLLFPAPLLLIPLAGGGRSLVLALLFLAQLGAGLGVMILDITGGSIMAAVIPDQVRARVTGAFLLVNYGIRPLGSLAGGLLGQAIGLRTTLWIATVGAVAGVLWLLPSPVRALRQLPSTAS
ncbi:MAG TPA: MFS transporter [Actinomycetes bacterium]|jgi:MFS family permease|nr:MFS transporter [Actinomycetes bacterium]